MKLKFSLSVLIAIILLSANSYPQDLKGNNYLGRSLNFSAHKTQTVTNQATDFQKTTDGSIIYVPTDYPIIQDAIDASADGDTVIIEEGTYDQQFRFYGKAIAVGSRYLLDNDTTHISKTIIDGSTYAAQDNASIVYFVDGEDYSSLLCGLTLQNGQGTYGSNNNWQWKVGGAIEMESAGGTIRRNIIRNNSCTGDFYSQYETSGGGIDCFDLPDNKSVIIEENELYNNHIMSKFSWGGAIEFQNVSGTVLVTKNSIISNSVSSRAGAYGGAICVITGSSQSIEISNNYIYNNQAEGQYPRGGGIGAENVLINIFNNIISSNSSIEKENIQGDAAGGGISVRYYSGTPAVPIMKGNILNNTIIKNKTGGDVEGGGGGIFARTIDVDIYNNIIRENISSNGAQIGSWQMAGYSLNAEYSNIEDGYTGTGNIDENPIFCDSSYCFLTSDLSPCIDAGNPDMIYNDILNGNAAYFPAMGSARNDMGAYGGPNSEWWKDIWWNPVLDVDDQFELNPGEFSISQNYPNPFNPSTKINYVIPSGVEGLTTLKIYDILGKEVATLINENKQPGTYEVEFNADKLTSGVYFYKLQASEFIATKKMLLIK